MRPSVRTLIGRLDVGYYMVNVNAIGGACAVPLSRPERHAFEEIWGALGHTGRHPKDWEAGTYLVRVDEYGNCYNAVGMNAAESRAFIADVLGGAE